MPSRTIKTTNGGSYGTLQRGCSFMIPVQLKNEQDQGLDLSEYCAAFTVKKVQSDFDRHDDFCYIKKDIDIQSPQTGQFYIQLTSEDTDFEPGEYYFDIELIHQTNGMVWRLIMMTFTLEGGPTNRYVNSGNGMWPTGETITVMTLATGNPIIIISQTLSLDTQVFAQLTTVLEKQTALEGRIEQLEETQATLESKVKELEEQLEDILTTP